MHVCVCVFGKIWAFSFVPIFMNRHSRICDHSLSLSSSHSHSISLFFCLSLSFFLPLTPPIHLSNVVRSHYHKSSINPSISSLLHLSFKFAILSTYAPVQDHRQACYQGHTQIPRRSKGGKWDTTHHQTLRDSKKKIEGLKSLI